MLADKGIVGFFTGPPVAKGIAVGVVHIADANRNPGKLWPD